MVGLTLGVMVLGLVLLRFARSGTEAMAGFVCMVLGLILASRLAGG